MPCGLITNRKANKAQCLQSENIVYVILSVS